MFSSIIYRKSTFLENGVLSQCKQAMLTHCSLVTEDSKCEYKNNFYLEGNLEHIIHGVRLLSTCISCNRIISAKEHSLYKGFLIFKKR